MKYGRVARLCIVRLISGIHEDERQQNDVRCFNLSDPDPSGL